MCDIFHRFFFFFLMFHHLLSLLSFSADLFLVFVLLMSLIHESFRCLEVLKMKRKDKETNKLKDWRIIRGQGNVQYSQVRGAKVYQK